MNRWLEYCVKQARRRETTQRYRLHVVLIRGGRVLVEGRNQPLADGSFQTMNPRAPEWMGIHAEMDCLRRAHEGQLRGAIMYIGGVNANAKMIRTAPCPFCAEVLAESGLAGICWHDEYGNSNSTYTGDLKLSYGYRVA